MADYSKPKAATKPVATKSLPRVSRKLSESGAGKYVVHIGFTFAQLTELRRAVEQSLKAQNAIKHDKAAGAKAHELAGYRAESLSSSRRYLEEAHQIIKSATNARQQGRFNAKQKDNATLSNLEGRDGDSE